jgi:hypothetical protein
MSRRSGPTSTLGSSMRVGTPTVSRSSRRKRSVVSSRRMPFSHDMTRMCRTGTAFQQMNANFTPG